MIVMGEGATDKTFGNMHKHILGRKAVRGRVRMEIELWLEMFLRQMCKVCEIVVT